MADKSLSTFSRVGNGRPPAIKAGERYGLLIVLNPDYGRDAKWNRLVLCQCDCGVIVVRVANRLRAGVNKSCGCLLIRPLSARYISHAKPTTEYVIYRKMIERCYNQNHQAYALYGGRGIVVCDRWIESFENFLGDMGQRPSKEVTLDRRDNDGPYSPDNCRWATRKEQNRNNRGNRLVAYKGETKSASEWAELYGMPGKIVINRLWNGWSVERALITPLIRRSR